jgi:hypothetical protein
MWPNIKRVLVVLVMPSDEAQWLGQTTEELVIRHCTPWRLGSDYRS